MDECQFSRKDAKFVKGAFEVLSLAKICDFGMPIQLQVLTDILAKQIILRHVRRPMPNSQNIWVSIIFVYTRKLKT